MAYTADNLISAIERKSFAPSNQSTFSSAEILSMANEILSAVIVPNIVQIREDYYLFKKDYTVTASQSEYMIPARSVGSTIRDVVLINSSGNIKQLPRIEYEDQMTTSVGSVHGYYLKDNKIVLYRTPSTTGDTLRVTYFLEPGDLVLASEGAVISAINTSTNVITVSSTPSTWATGNRFDLVSGVGSQSYRDIELTSTLVSGTNITLPSLPSDLAVGDYVNLTGYSSLVQIPNVYRMVLAQLTAAEILGATSQPNAGDAQKKGVALLESAQGMIAPRTRGDSRYITPNQWF